MIDLAALTRPIQADELSLEPLSEAHREGLRACCEPDDPVWEIYPINMAGAAFDTAFDGLITNKDRHIFAIVENGEVEGMTSYLNLALDRQTLEVGGTFMAPRTRGSGLNGRVKKLVIDRAFAEGVRRIQFMIDERNQRSQAAVLKLGAKKEGVLRADRITWNGHVRDTGVFGLLREEWGER